MTASPYAQVDAGYVTMDWLNSLADLKAKLTTRGRVAIYMDVPSLTTLPLLAFAQVSGGTVGDDFVYQQARISFDVFARNRFQVSDIKDTLISSIEALGPTGGFTSAKGSIHNARTVNVIYRREPGLEPDDMIFRFIVDSYFLVSPA